jgi:Zn-dependent protease/CBS domain-containing protein
LRKKNANHLGQAVVFCSASFGMNWFGILIAAHLLSLDLYIIRAWSISGDVSKQRLKDRVECFVFKPNRRELNRAARLFMRGGIHIGRLFGISIRIDWSWIFIFLLVTWNLAAGVLPAWHPDWGPALNWTVAAVASLLFFASVLAHELSHSLVAKARGLPVRRITLFLFGGVSNIEREPESPSTEFLMAVVGPITSIALGVFFLLLGGITISGMGYDMGEPSRLISQLGPVSTLLMWLGPINILVGIFNLVPGFPLDGGRILRSILWGLTNDLRKATRWASVVGQVIAWTLIVSGIAMVFGVQVPFFGTGLISGLWLVFIGWFLNNAAIGSYQQIVIQDLLEDVPVERLMKRDMMVITPDLLVSNLVYDVIMGSDERAFPVMEGERLIGLVTLEDIRKLPREAWDRTMATEIMTPAEQLAVATPAEDASEALDKLTRRDVRQVPVVQEGRLVGLLRRRDIVRWLQLHSEFVTG